jgi:hypothetical protein
MRAPIVVMLGLLVATGCTQQPRPHGIWDVQQVPLVLEGAPLAEPWSVLEVDESQGDVDAAAERGAFGGFLAGPVRHHATGSSVAASGASGSHPRGGVAVARAAVAHGSHRR